MGPRERNARLVVCPTMERVGQPNPRVAPSAGSVQASGRAVTPEKSRGISVDSGASEPPGPPGDEYLQTPGEPEPASIAEGAVYDARRLQSPTPRVGLVLAAAAVIGFVLYLGRDALSPFIVGLLLVYLLDPPVEWLGRIGFPRTIAVLAVYGIVLLVVVEAVNLTLPPLVDQASRFVKDLPSLVHALDLQLRSLTEVYRGLDLPPALRTAIDRALADASKNAGQFDPGVLVPVFGSVFGLILSIFGYLIIPVWVFYLLKDRPSLTAAFDRSLPAEWRSDVWAIFGIVRDVFGQWVRGQLILSVTVGVATYVGLLLLNSLVDPVFGRFAVLLAILAGLLELLPIIGPILAAVPLVLLAATASGEAMISAIVLAFVIQQLENYLLVPKIQGDAVRLHPSAVMFALIMGAAIAGLLGAILSLPVTAAARDLYRYLFRRLSIVPERAPVARAAAESSAAEGAAIDA